MFALLLSLAAVAAPTPTPAVTFERTGGFAPRDERVVVSPGGHATLSDHGVVTRRLTLTAAQRTTLRRAVATADVTRPYAPGPDSCADCFEYDLRLSGHHVHAVQDAIPRRFQPLIAFFEDLLSRRASGTAGTR